MDRKKAKGTDYALFKYKGFIHVKIVTIGKIAKN